MSVISPKELDRIEATLNRLEEKARPKAEKIVKRGKDGQPSIEYFKHGRSHHFDAAKAELARTSTFVPVLPFSHENGTKVALPNASEAQVAARPSVPKGDVPSAVASPEVATAEVRELTALVGLSFHEASRGAGVSPALQETDEIDDNPLADLIRRAQGGDEDAMNRLFARHLPELRRWARGRLPAAAREVPVQPIGERRDAEDGRAHDLLGDADNPAPFELGQQHDHEQRDEEHPRNREAVREIHRRLIVPPASGIRQGNPGTDRL